MTIDKKTAVDAFGRFAAEIVSGSLQKEAAADWKLVKAYIDAEADKVAESDPPMVDRTAVVLANEAASIFRMQTGSSDHWSDLETDIWDTIYRFREKTITAQVMEAYDKYGDDDVLAAYLDAHKNSAE